MEAALLDAAADILQSEGPDGLSVRRIAAAAGVAPMGVYNHFESKFGIIDALFIRGFERLGQAMDSIADISDSYEALRQAGQRYRALALKHPMEYRIMFMQSVPGFEPSDKAMEVAASAFAALVAAVQRAMAAGIIAEGPPTDTAQMIWASIHGWVSLELLDIGFVEDQAAGYDQVCAAMLRGLRPNDDAWAGYLRTEVEFTPPDRAPFTVRPAPPGVVGQWPEGFGSGGAGRRARPARTRGVPDGRPGSGLGPP
jgi:AcrR family transcriptional regulator